MMKKPGLILIFSLICLAAFDQSGSDTDLVLWYKTPAANWNEALPVGNGKLGAMVFGGINEERLQLNEESVWTRDGKIEDKQDAKKYIPEIRKMLFAGKVTEAQKLTIDKILSPRLPTGTNTYQSLGNIRMEFENYGRISNYSRELDLKNAIARVSYFAGKTHFTREIFSSAPDDALLMKITADQPGQISFSLKLDRSGANPRITYNDDGTIIMKEHLGNGNGVQMETRLKINVKGGELTNDGNSLTVKNADEAILILVAATNYRGGDPQQLCIEKLSKLKGKDYTSVRSAHIKDYQNLFNRVKLELGTSEAVHFATNERLDALKRGSDDPDLIELYFQFGRYLLISSSRPGSLPANLQGIWADGMKPPWNADYHTNINVQMNYWPAEVTNLSECHLPLFDFTTKMIPNGKKTAKTIYECKGFVVHHTTDVWFPTSPMGKPGYGMWPMGGAWLALHPWEHYLYTGDKDFLKTRAWPIMKEAAIFFIDFLVKDPETGWLVSGPSMSPENSYLDSEGKAVSMDMGPTMDQEIIYNLFKNTIEASKILNTDEKLRKTLEKKMKKLAPVQIGANGTIMEWRKDYKEAEPGHRHMSHLFALYPGTEFSFSTSPEMMEASRKTLERRLLYGGGHTGWSRAWIINFYARLHDGNEAFNNIQALLMKSTLPNLFDNHPPFQIDGNFGGTAGIAEMLLQSHAGEIVLLPALPDKWTKGNVKGLMARGGFQVDMKWENGELVKMKLLSKLGNTCHITYKDKTIDLNTKKGVNYFFNMNLVSVE
jgi:alpha-L-fucosidase 2